MSTYRCTLYVATYWNNKINDYLVMAIFFQVLIASFLGNLAASPFLAIVQLLPVVLIIAIHSVHYLKEKGSY